jgi:hypothetical protein
MFKFAIENFVITTFVHLYKLGHMEKQYVFEVENLAKSWQEFHHCDVMDRWSADSRGVHSAPPVHLTNLALYTYFTQASKPPAQSWGLYSLGEGGLGGLVGVV